MDEFSSEKSTKVKLSFPRRISTIRIIFADNAFSKLIQLYFSRLSLSRVLYRPTQFHNTTFPCIPITTSEYRLTFFEITHPRCSPLEEMSTQKLRHRKMRTGGNSNHGRLVKLNKVCLFRIKVDSQLVAASECKGLYTTAERF